MGLTMECINLNALFRLGKDDYPERKRTTIIVTDDGDNVRIGVKAIARVYEKDAGGNLNVHEEQYGSLCTMHKDAPIGCLFDSLKKLFDEVPEIVDRTTDNGDKA